MNRFTIICIALFFILQGSVLADTIYVDGSNTAGPWDGTQTYPFMNIQDGIDTALAGDTVLVLAGLYYENIDFTGKGITVISESGPYVTTIDGNLSGSCVLFINAETQDAVLSGFTLTNGSGTYNGGGPDLYNGSGIYCVGSNPTIVNNIISDNVSAFDGMGGGICCENQASPTIQNNIIINNFLTPVAADYISGGGGGVACLNESHPLITENIIAGNSGAYAGGGVFCVDGSSPTVSYNYIYDNYSGYAYGGGIFCKVDAAPIITNNTICDNYTDQWGGGIYAWQSNPVVTYNNIYGNLADNGGGIYFYDNCNSPIRGNHIHDNTALFDGGGIWVGHTSSPDIEDNVIHHNMGSGICCYNTAFPLIRNNRIYNNEAVNGGGGINCVNDCSPTITNNTIVENSSSQGGGLCINIDCTTVTVTNTILWNNTAPAGPEIWIGDTDNPSTLTISYSLVTNGQDSVRVISGSTLNWNAKMITTSPKFLNKAEGDFHLDYDSSCIDLGNNSAPGIPATDPDGNSRTWDGDGDGTGTADIGYDEYAPLLVPDLYATIQAAIDAATHGDVVLVNPGEYIENIDFSGKAIRIMSRSGPDMTVINGNQAGSTVTFAMDETQASILDGFSVINGNAVNGGGILCDATSPQIFNSIITGNTATYGAGLHCSAGASPAVINNLVTANSADFGGGFSVYSATPIITNNTVVENTATYHGGGIYSTVLSDVVTTNVILYGNTALLGNQIYLGDTVDFSTMTISYCNVEGGRDDAYVEAGCTLNWNDGMIDADPQFVDQAGGDFHILYDSPCRDAGDSTPQGRSDQDFEGDTRLAEAATDIGMDEFYPHLYITGDKTPGGWIDGKLLGWPGAKQVAIWFAFSVRKPPAQTAYGPFHLAPPTIGPIGLFPIPANGLISVHTRLSETPPAPYAVPMQALVGNELTNLFILYVE